MNANVQFKNDLFLYNTCNYLIMGKNKDIFKYTFINKHYKINEHCFNHMIPQTYCYCHFKSIHPIFTNYTGVPMGKFNYSTFINYDDDKLVIVQDYNVHTFDLIKNVNLKWLSNYHHHVLVLHRYYKKYLLPELIHYIIKMLI